MKVALFSAATVFGAAAASAAAALTVTPSTSAAAPTTVRSVYYYSSPYFDGSERSRRSTQNHQTTRRVPTMSFPSSTHDDSMPSTSASTASSHSLGAASGNSQSSPSSRDLSAFSQQQSQQHNHQLQQQQTVLLALELSVCPEDVYTDDQFAYRVYANLPIGLFGILANILNVIVFCDVEMRTMLVNHFLLALSISDLVLLLCNFFFLVLPVIVVDTSSFFWNDLFPIIVRYSYPLALTAQTSGVYLTVLVSVHRFLGVCYPFRAKRWVTRKPVQYAIAAAVLFSVLVNIPTWLELSVMACFSRKFNRISRQIALAPFHDMTYILVKKTVVYTFVMFFVPFFTLIVVNWRIILALRESSNLRTMHTYSTKAAEFQQQQDNSLKQFHLLKNSRYSEIFHTFSKMSNTGFGYFRVFRPTTDMFKTKFTNSTRDRSVTLMLLAIVALFLLCNGLAFCNSIVESIMLIRGAAGDDTAGDGTSSSPMASEATIEESTAAAAENADLQNIVKMFEISVEISNVLITLNSATSALVYLIFSSKYRLVLKSILGFRKRKKINRVAVTTALAAQRAVELSLIPEEADNRKRQMEEQQHQQQILAYPTLNSRKGEMALSSNNRRTPRLFRAQTITTAGGTSTLPHSESNLRFSLMDDEENSISIEEKTDASNISDCR